MAGEQVSVLGAGNMGSALARAMSAAGHRVTVWNRTRSKCESLSDVATVASDLEEAVAASPLVVISLSDYKTSNRLIHQPGVVSRLAGRTLIQFTSGTPEDARISEKWAHGNGVDYLDAAILGYPGMIATEHVTIFYAGPETVYLRHLPVLRALAANSVFVDERIGSAATLDCAILNAYYGGSAAFLHGAAMCEAEGLPIDQFFEYQEAFLGLIRVTADMARPMLSTRNYRGEQCSLNTHVGALRHLVRLSQQAGIDEAFPQQLFSLYESAAKSGRGREELPAIFETLLNRPRS